MINYILWVLGIVISFALFWVSYRKTIGAKHERIGNANTAIERILIRRVVIEGYTPTLADLSRLIEGKARDYKVDAEELYSETQVLNCVYTRIVESELITKEKRDEALTRITPVLFTKIFPVQSEEAVREAAYYTSAKRKQIIALVLMGLLTSLGGVSLTGIVSKVSGLPFLFGTSEMPTGFFIMMGASMAIMTAMAFIKRLLESEEETTNKGKSVAGRIIFERGVLQVLERSGVAVDMSTDRNTEYDAAIELNGNKTLIDIQYWPHPVFEFIIRNIMRRLQTEVKQMGATEAIIVTSRPIDSTDLDVKEVKVMSLNELRNYLAPGR